MTYEELVKKLVALKAVGNLKGDVKAYDGDTDVVSDVISIHVSKKGGDVLDEGEIYLRLR